MGVKYAAPISLGEYRITDTNPEILNGMSLDEIEDRLSDLRDVLPILTDLEQIEIVKEQIFKYVSRCKGLTK